MTLLVLVGTWLDHHLGFQHDGDPQILLQAMEELEESDEVLGHMTWHLE